MMRSFALSLALSVALTPLALAAETAPGDVSFADMAVADSLTGQPGDPVEGRKVFANRGLGNCLACHMVQDLESELFHGNVGPALDGVAERWEPGQIRAIVANAKEIFGEQTIMPGFYTLDVGVDVAEKFQGKTILSAQQVEDVVAYLATLKGE
ncbi:sulfur oxidation c-type cytochrome SoxX [Aurantimonas coralicida]|jgi:L-cysteine S-thiosulfotransferase|nr:sulfur oxidation c-type cytochrome SoxX [Aurantimonas coralicida]MCC4298485.1 sulfur oxidation c-type cytochrome SoxX [Aurantimonas coralicida]